MIICLYNVHIQTLLHYPSRTIVVTVQIFVHGKSEVWIYEVKVLSAISPRYYNTTVTITHFVYIYLLWYNRLLFNIHILTAVLLL